MVILSALSCIELYDVPLPDPSAANDSWKGIPAECVVVSVPANGICFWPCLFLAVQCAPKDLFGWFVQPRNSSGFCTPSRAKFEEDTVYLWAMGLKNLFPAHPMPKETRLRLRSKHSATHEDIAIWLYSSVLFWIHILNESIAVLFWKWLTLVFWLKAILSVTLFWMSDSMSRLVQTRLFLVFLHYLQFSRHGQRQRCRSRFKPSPDQNHQNVAKKRLGLCPRRVPLKGLRLGLVSGCGRANSRMEQGRQQPTLILFPRTHGLKCL